MNKKTEIMKLNNKYRHRILINKKLKMMNNKLNYIGEVIMYLSLIKN